MTRPTAAGSHPNAHTAMKVPGCAARTDTHTQGVCAYVDLDADSFSAAGSYDCFDLAFLSFQTTFIDFIVWVPCVLI